MQINQVLSGCKVLIDRAGDSNILKFYLFILFIILPLLKVTSSIIKTKNKIDNLNKDCSSKLPVKLERLIKLHNIDSNKIAVSCSTDFVAVTTGFINKKIIFSRSLISKLTSKELEAVLLHELHHLKNNHSIILFIGEVVVSTFFFLPILRDLMTNIKTEFERSADCAAVEYQQTPRYVKQSLLKVLSADAQFSFFPHFAYHILDQRLDNLNYKKKKYYISKTRSFVSALTMIVFIVLLHLNAKYAMASVMEEHITCTLFECVQDCVATELTFKKEPMSPNNFSLDQ